MVASSGLDRQNRERVIPRGQSAKHKRPFHDRVRVETATLPVFIARLNSSSKSLPERTSGATSQSR